jgi:autotransporter translocation and assembly factor TamB
VRVAELAVASLEVAVEQDELGAVNLARAFAPRAPEGGPSRGTDLSLARVAVDHAWVHGRLAAVPVLDVDLDGLEGAFASTPRSTAIDVDRLHLRARGMPGRDPDGAITAHATLPAGGERTARASYEGRVGAIEVRAEGSLAGDQVDASIDIPSASPKALAALAPGAIEVRVPVSVHATVGGRLPVLEPAISARIGGGTITAAGTVQLPTGDSRETVASATLAVIDLDAGHLAAGAPRSRISAVLDIAATARGSDRVEGTYHLSSAVSMVAGEAIPAIRARGDFTERSLRGEARIAERGAPIAARFSLDRRGQVTLRAETTIADLGALTRFGHLGRGRAHVVVDGRADLRTRQIAATVSADAAGLVVKDVRLERGWIAASARGPLASPSLTAEVNATALRAGSFAFSRVALRASGSPRDLGVTAQLDGEPWSARLAGRLAWPAGQARIRADLRDAAGPLAAIEADARLPLHGRRDLLATPLTATIRVPRRALSSLPVAFGELPITGDVALTAELQGTLRAPRLRVVAEGTELRPRAVALCVPPFAATARLGYDGERATLRVDAARAGRPILAAGATVRARVADLLAGRVPRWEADADLALQRFPLEPVATLLGRPFAGELGGMVALRGLHRDARLVADLDLRDLVVDRAAVPHSVLHVRLGGGRLAVATRLEQPGGFAVVRAVAPASWGASLSPTLDPARPVDGTLRAENFRANVLLPFLAGSVSELDGRLDADAKIHVEPGGARGAMSGAVTLRDGVLEVPQIGERFHALRGRVTIRPWGTVRFDDVSAEGPTGRFTASAQAVLHGLRLDRASAELHIPDGESLPLAVEGTPLGSARGDVSARARVSPDGRRVDILVDVPSFHLDLPPSSGHAAQRLDADPTVRIGHQVGRDFLSLPLGPGKTPRSPTERTIHARVRLGDDVTVKRDTTIALSIEGDPVIDVGAETRVSGQIRITRGELELQGKRFTVDQGAVTFVGKDPADPTIVASAHWDGPEGTRVFADYSGQVRSGRLTLRSDPPLSQDEILALVLFGSPDGTFGAEAPGKAQESAGARVAGLAGGVIAQGLNKAISGITSADVTTRVDTSEAGNPRPEVTIQLSKDVTARVGYKLGVPAPGENPDRTELTVDWRFVRDWSLSAGIGDAGSTAVDVLWRYRY